MALSPKVTVASRPDGERGLFARSRIEAGEAILTYDGPLLDHPTRLSIQIDDGLHVEGTEESNAFLNHACEPTAYVDWEARRLCARVPIEAGGEVTCNYLTTDDEIHSPFVCRCGAAACKGEIRGFRFLTAEEQGALAPWLPPFLKRRLRP